MNCFRNNAFLVNSVVKHSPRLQFVRLRQKWSIRSFCDKSSKTNENGLTVKHNETANKVEEAKRKLTHLLQSMSAQKSDEQSLSIKLSKPDPISQRKREMPKPEIVDANDVSKDLNERLLQAAKALSSKIGGEEAKKTESELVKMIQTNAEETINNALGIKKSLPDLSKVISGMSVDKKEKLIEPGRLVRSSEVDMDVGYKRKPPELMRGSITEGKVKGFMERGQPLGIFSQKMTPNPDEPKLETWDELARHELQTLITHTPENAYEEMIAWTEKGKLWQYPIDNEAGLDEERKVPFYEHVLLDEHLEGFPDKGPVRDFMEVMIIGLSKNPFMTASRKREYIDWFRQYFKDKESLIKASTAL